MDSAGRFKPIVALDELFFDESVLEEFFSDNLAADRLDEFDSLFEGQSGS